jgi:GTP-binding protein EngB required for normal cell division
MGPNRVPEFAIVGHPNEGKSSVVSTLAEDDSVRISQTPGETMECQEFPVVIDGKEIIRFIDTPGFQNPKRILQWMREYQGPDDRMVQIFREAHARDPEFHDDVELFGPVELGAGIIYVVDGSRPVRNADRAEMEILRLTGRPRMAIINCKDPITGYLDDWKSEFRKHFNAIRVFNAHKATYAERLALLENLKSIDQDWQPALETVIQAFQREWEHRTAVTADVICEMLTNCIQFRIQRNFTEKSNEAGVLEELQADYAREVEKIERSAHQKIRKLFKHNIFNVDLPAHSILHEDLFNEKTWQFLGLKPRELVAAAGLAGGAAGAALDVAAAGLTFGVFTALGGAIGAGWAALGGGKRLARTQVVGLSLGGHQMRMGPNENIQFLYILLDRSLIFYSHIINWAHGRRDYPAASPASEAGKAGVTTEWGDAAKKTCGAFFRAIRAADEGKRVAAKKEMKQLLQGVLQSISHSERKYGLVIKSAA